MTTTTITIEITEDDRALVGFTHALRSATTEQKAHAWDALMSSQSHATDQAVMDACAALIAAVREGQTS